MKKETKNKEEKTNKFIDVIKKKWIINSSKTILLVAIIIGAFIGITILMQNLNLAPIDLTEDKLYTLTEESKEQIKLIDKNVNIYFIGYSDSDPILDLVKQYKNVNEKINVEIITADSRPDLVQKYGIEKDSQGIIVESDKQFKILTQNDLYTYDYSTYETINIVEEKMTSAIKSVATEKLPKVYFLSGYSSFSLNKGMTYLGMYLQNEVNEIEILDILSQGKVPEDCDTLVITSPEKDFDDIATKAIVDYINNGGNILWLNAAIAKKVDFPNANKVLAIYGIKPFEVGIIRETEASKMVSEAPDLIMPEIQYSDVTSKLYNSEGVIFLNATKINVVSDEELEKLNVEKTNLILTSENAYYRTNFAIQTNNPSNEEKKGQMLVGAKLDKKISDEKKSVLIIYGENYFVSDYQITQSSYTPMVAYRKNKDLVLNSIAYLTDREEDITVRKSTGTVTYTATQQEHIIILMIIFIVPILVIIAGIVVWIIRKRKK